MAGEDMNRDSREVTGISIATDTSGTKVNKSNLAGGLVMILTGSIVLATFYTVDEAGNIYPLYDANGGAVTRSVPAVPCSFQLPDECYPARKFVMKGDAVATAKVSLMG